MGVEEITSEEWRSRGRDSQEEAGREQGKVVWTWKGTVDELSECPYSGG